MPLLKGSLLKISEDQSEYAKMVAAKMSDVSARKKGLIEILGITCAVNFLSAAKIKVNLKKSLHKVPVLLEDFKVTDIYYNNHRIDVITVFREKKIRIPRIHYDYDIRPNYYLVVQIGARLKESKILGYINPKDVLGSRCDNKYYYPKDEILRDTQDFLNLIKIGGPLPSTAGKHIECMAMFLRYIDGELSTTYKKLFIKHLLSCETCVKKLADVIEFDNAAKNIAKYPRSIKKYYDKISRIHTVVQKPETFVKKAELKIQKEKNVKEEHFAISEEKQKENKKAIDYIFKEKPKFEASALNIITAPAYRKKVVSILACGLVLVFLCVFIVIKNSGQNISSIDNLNNENYEQQSSLDPLNPNSGLGTYDSQIPQDIPEFDKTLDYSLASEANGEPIVATINKVSWEIPENMASKESYKKFLQLAGKNIKLNLQNDLLLSNDFAKNNTIKVDVKFAHNGTLGSLKIVQSSGSEQIDGIIKKSVSETLSYMKPPNMGFISKSADLTLVINL